MSQWRMEKMCATCPFATSGPGLALRKALARGRFAEIKRGLLEGEYFVCHKTTRHDDDDEYQPGSNDRLCAGAIEFQEEHGTTSNYQRVCESLDYFAQKRAERAKSGVGQGAEPQ